MESFPCTICQNAGHKASICPELYHPEKASSGGGGHSHDDDDEKIITTVKSRKNPIQPIQKFILRILRA